MCVCIYIYIYISEVRRETKENNKAILEIKSKFDGNAYF